MKYIETGVSPWGEKTNKKLDWFSPGSPRSTVIMQNDRPLWFTMSVCVSYFTFNRLELKDNNISLYFHQTVWTQHADIILSENESDLSVGK